ncbi:FAD-dependent monooxygenase [Candidatus Pelagibacter sp.]|nr:FAD-dependent monooxygenase [Candidatus Pelagibacter sp.]
MKVGIIGTGLSSLTLAKALVNQNITVDLITGKKIKKPEQSRTIGISKANLEFFNKNIIDITKIVWKLKKIEIFTDNLKQEKLINFENQNQELFSILKNYKLFQVLEKNLSQNKYFNKIPFNKNLSFLKNYDLIINTDYSNIITKKYFSKKIVKKYECFAYTAIISHFDIKNDTASQIFTKRGPLAFLPVSRNETSVVYSMHKSKNKKIDNIEDLIKYYNLKYKIKKIEKIESFELKSLNLRSYYYNNILAFGDLLHRIHPLAGQGFNMTIRDISTLIDIIKNKYSLGLPIDSSINSEFENSLKHKNYIFSNGVDLIHEFFNFERKINTNVLSKSVKIIAKSPYINKLLINFADKGIVI